MAETSPNGAGEVASPSVLRKAFDILGVFAAGPRVLSISEVARRCDVPKSTTHRILAMLVEVNALQRVPGGYKIGIGLFSLGSRTLDRGDFDAMSPHLYNLQAATQSTVHISAYNGASVVVLDKLLGRQSPTTRATVGGMLPSGSTAAGKVLLAYRDPEQTVLDAECYSRLTTTMKGTLPLREYLRSVARSGFAVELEETELGVACVAAPLIVERQAIGAVTIVKRPDDDLHRLIAPVRHTAVLMAKALVEARARQTGWVQALGA